jgi:hypothetical protein
MSFLAAIPIVGSLFDSIGNAIDKNVTSIEEKLKMKNEFTALVVPLFQVVFQAQAEFDKLQQQIRLAELQSGDRFVRWTRPAMTWLTFIFWGYCVVTGNPQAEYAFYAFGLIAGIFSATRGSEKIVAKWSNGKNGNGK